jgi:hypothetical protein
MLNMRQDQRRINKRRRQEIVVIWKQSLEKLLDYSHGHFCNITDIYSFIDVCLFCDNLSVFSV